MRKFVSFFLIFTLLVTPLPISATEVSTSSYSYTFGKYDYVTKEESTETIVTDYTSLGSVQNIQQRDTTAGNGMVVYTEAYTPNEPQSASMLRQSSSITPALPVNSEAEALAALAPVTATVSPYKKITLNANGFDFVEPAGADYWTYGTGFMEGNDVLLTNFHLMYHTGEAEWATEVRVYTQVSTSEAGLSSLSYVYPQTWYWTNSALDDLESHDWMVMVLQADVGATTGWFGKAYSPGTLSDIAITCSGYPDIQGYKRYQYMSEGYLDSISTYRVAHTAVSVGGLSGSPLFDSDNIVWAVNRGHALDWSTSYGVRITQNLYNLLQEQYLAGRERWGYND